MLRKIHSGNSREAELDQTDGVFIPELTPRVINSLRAKFWGGDINIHFHFMSLLHIDITQVLKILPQVRTGPTYST